MIVFILGTLDILSGLSIFTLGFSWGPALISFLVLYLIAKSLPYITNPASMVDLSVAVVYIVALLGYSNTILNAICALWLIQKGVVSFF